MVQYAISRFLKWFIIPIKDNSHIQPLNCESSHAYDESKFKYLYTVCYLCLHLYKYKIY